MAVHLLGRADMTRDPLYLKRLPMIDQSFCTGCRLCTDYCLSGALVIDGGMVFLAHPERCLSEGRCAEVCPMGGLHMEWSSFEADHSVGQWRLAGSPA